MWTLASIRSLIKKRLFQEAVEITSLILDTKNWENINWLTEVQMGLVRDKSRMKERYKMSRI